MNKKEYIKPRLTVIKIAAHKLMTGSQFDTPVNNPNDEVDAGEALSRRKQSLWEEYEED